MSLRLVFMGTPDFSVAILAALIDAGHQIAAVYSQPPRPAGRGHQERPSPVHAFAAAKGIAVHTPKSLRSPEAQAEFAALASDAAVVAAYGLILPKAVLAAPRLGCINVHASLLPRWRGAAPIQRAIEAGDETSGVTIMQMDEGLDTGAMLLAGQVTIGRATNAGMLHDALSDLGAKLVVEALAGLEAGSLAAVPQPEAGVTYAQKLARDEGRLDWSLPAVRLERMVMAFTPWPGAWFTWKGERIKVLEAEAVPGQGRAGLILDDHLSIACGEGALRLLKLQRPGKQALDAESFLRGFPLGRGVELAEECPATN